MNQEFLTGINRTGAQMAPKQSKEAAQFALSKAIDVPADELDEVEFRHAYMAESDVIGSVPQPKTVKGKAKTIVSKIKGGEPDVLIDKLGERLAFERTGVRLYEALITKCSADGVSGPLADAGIDLQQLTMIREDEERHFNLIGEAIVALGGDPTSVTPCADVAGVNALGILQTMSDPRTSVAQAMNSMLTIELADSAGWTLLIDIAGESGHEELAESFKEAEIAEASHVLLVRTWLRALVLADTSQKS